MIGLKIAAVIGLPFALIAGLMAYIITYGEYSHHFIEPGKIKKHAFEAALVAFSLFAAISLIIGLFVKF